MIAKAINVAKPAAAAYKPAAANETRIRLCHAAAKDPIAQPERGSRRIPTGMHAGRDTCQQLIEGQQKKTDRDRDDQHPFNDAATGKSLILIRFVEAIEFHDGISGRRSKR